MSILAVFLAMLLQAAPEAGGPEGSLLRAGSTQVQLRVQLWNGSGSLSLQLQGGWSSRPSRGPQFPCPAGLQVRMTSAHRVEVAGAVDDSIQLVPADTASRFCLGKRCYRGALQLSVWQNKILAVNRIELEDYLLGVVPGEIGRKLDSSVLEAAKAQAVVARTYAVRGVKLWPSRPWDLFDDVRDQVYEGASLEDPLCSRAVRSTEGQILVDASGELVDAYYHSTSGGFTGDIRRIWPNKPSHPYLYGMADTMPDGRPWCWKSRHASWTESWDAKSLLTEVRRYLPEAVPGALDPGTVTDLQVSSSDPSGRIVGLTVVGSLRTIQVPPDRARWLLRRPIAGRPILRSSRFKLERSGANFVATGSGNGHGIGLCQTGALGRAAFGQGAKEILYSYYPETHLCPVASVLP